jgi:hypothetical protein
MANVKKYTKKEIDRRGKLLASIFGTANAAIERDYLKTSQHIHIGYDQHPLLDSEYSPDIIISFLSKFLILRIFSRDSTSVLRHIQEASDDIKNLMKNDIVLNLNSLVLEFGLSKHEAGQVVKSISAISGQTILCDYSEDIKKIVGTDWNIYSLLADVLNEPTLLDKHDELTLPSIIWFEGIRREKLIGQTARSKINEIATKAEAHIKTYLPSRLYKEMIKICIESLFTALDIPITSKIKKEIEDYVSKQEVRKLKLEKPQTRVPDFDWSDKTRQIEFQIRVKRLRKQYESALDLNQEKKYEEDWFNMAKEIKFCSEINRILLKEAINSRRKFWSNGESIPSEFTPYAYSLKQTALEFEIKKKSGASYSFETLKKI